MATFPDGSGLLDTPSDWWDVGYGWAVGGSSTGEMMQGVRRECGALADWQRECLARGHAAGVRDRAAFEADMASGVGVVCDCSEVPF